MNSKTIQDLRKKLVNVINETSAPKDLTGIVEALSYVLLDLATSVLDIRASDLNKELIEKIKIEHDLRPSLASALFLQSITMLGWNKDAGTVSK